jgi:hypothetical protein
MSAESTLLLPRLQSTRRGVAPSSPQPRHHPKSTMSVIFSRHLFLISNFFSLQAEETGLANPTPAMASSGSSTADADEMEGGGNSGWASEGSAVNQTVYDELIKISGQNNFNSSRPSRCLAASFAGSLSRGRWSLFSSSGLPSLLGNSLRPWPWIALRFSRNEKPSCRWAKIECVIFSFASLYALYLGQDTHHKPFVAPPTRPRDAA